MQKLDVFDIFKIVFVSKSSIKKVKMLVNCAKIDEKNRKNFEKKKFFPNFFTGGGPFLA